MSADAPQVHPERSGEGDPDPRGAGAGARASNARHAGAQCTAWAPNFNGQVSLRCALDAGHAEPHRATLGCTVGGAWRLAPARSFDERDGAPRVDRSDAGARLRALGAKLREMLADATPAPWQTRFVHRAFRAARLAPDLMVETPEDKDWPNADLCAWLVNHGHEIAAALSSVAPAREGSERDPTGPGGPPAAGDEAEGQQ